MSGFDVLCDRLKTSLKEDLKITKPTKVQLRTLTPILNKQDVLIKSKTGSGKTLAYLLPTIQLLQSFRTTRADGTHVMIIAPTRELAIQIEEVVKKLLKSFPWLVSCSIMGGESKHKEKSRIRKGISIVIGTPGRLLDHLNNTQAFKIDRLQWLILDEADRLLDLGFEHAIKQLISILNLKKDPDLNRQNLLISATLDPHVLSLAKLTLTKPVFINLEGDEELNLLNNNNNNNNSGHIRFNQNTGNDDDDDDENDDNDDEKGKGKGGLEEEGFDTPSPIVVAEKLEQAYVVVPPKLRLTTLAAFLRLQSSLKECKMIVFVSTTDSVEFLHTLFTATTFYSNEDNNDNNDDGDDDNNNDNDDDDEDDDEEEEEEEEDYNAKSKKRTKKRSNKPKVQEPFLSRDIKILKLHGNMVQKERTDTFRSFKNSKASILICTDVAARGLDVPDIKWVVQFDPPLEVKEYVHRVGRTARFEGASGKSIIFLTSGPEELYPSLLRKYNLNLRTVKYESILRTVKLPYQINDMPPHMVLQKRFEKVIELNKPITELAQNAFRSYVRGYATYSKPLKEMFHVKNLHLGHLAKSFGLPQAPSKIVSGKRAKYHKQQSIETPKKKLKTKNEFNSNNLPEKRKNSFSEFASGF